MPTTGSRVELAFTPVPEHVRTARVVSVAYARRAGISLDLVDEVRLAVGEAASRAVTLHAVHAPDRPVRLLLEEVDGCVRVILEDEAPAEKLPSLGSSRDAGTQLADHGDDADNALVALAVLQGLVDSVEITTSRSGGTAVRLTWPVDQTQRV